MKGNKQNEGDSHPHRPQFHFTPLRNWMNDPNGLVYLDGIYHLFYQHNPHDNVWGDIHWGHATSTDLVRWTHEPLALKPDAEGLGLVASGCAVVDGANASGLQTGLRPVVVAIFTHFTPDDRKFRALRTATTAVAGGLCLLIIRCSKTPNAQTFETRRFSGTALRSIG